MRRLGISTKIGVTVATVGIATLGLAAPANAATEGCPSGYVCIYPSTNFNGGSPSLKFYTYGYHNLSNVVGRHRYFNNQTGGASTYACSGYNGTGTVLFGLDAGGWADEDFTPADSVVLNSSGSIPINC